ncbi:hypothetical protein BACI71_90016 [Bacillus mycoides]|uniref:Uncharacterized protein n=1 Tax=Bacillus mycoides TaxID=1405 RepID=A0A654BY83_BACMY|nr:hypothetical protein BACI71_90016 [Bacillus mycoides]
MNTLPDIGESMFPYLNCNTWSNVLRTKKLDIAPQVFHECFCYLL